MVAGVPWWTRYLIFVPVDLFFVLCRGCFVVYANRIPSSYVSFPSFSFFFLCLQGGGGSGGAAGGLKFTVADTCERIKEEFNFIQQQNHSWVFLFSLTLLDRLACSLFFFHPLPPSLRFLFHPFRFAFAFLQDPRLLTRRCLRPSCLLFGFLLRVLRLLQRSRWRCCIERFLFRTDRERKVGNCLLDVLSFLITPLPRSDRNDSPSTQGKFKASMIREPGYIYRDRIFTPPTTLTELRRKS